MIRRSISVLAVLVLSLAVSAPALLARQARQPLTAANIDDIATLLKLEDTRQFDEAVLTRIWQSTHPEVRRRAAISIGRIVDPAGADVAAALAPDRDAEAYRLAAAMLTGEDPFGMAFIEAYRAGRLAEGAAA